MHAFAQAEPIAAWIVRRIFRYDAFEASKALFGYSNEIGTYGEGRNRFKNQIERLLRISALE
jgi:hypothetical protein